MAVFLDLENIALGAHDAHFPAFDIRKVLDEKPPLINVKFLKRFPAYRDFIG